MSFARDANPANHRRPPDEIYPDQMTEAAAFARQAEWNPD
jgi:hypothetical protein